MTNTIRNPPWTAGEWLPESLTPTYNEGANAYQIAIVQYPRGESRSIPGFAFGDTKEQCMANAWLLASSKDLLKGLQNLMSFDPILKKEPEDWLRFGDACAVAMEAMQKAVGVKKI